MVRILGSLGLAVLLLPACVGAATESDPPAARPPTESSDDQDPGHNDGPRAPDVIAPVPAAELGNYDFVYFNFEGSGPVIRLGNLDGESRLVRQTPGGIWTAVAPSHGGDRLAFVAIDADGRTSLRVLELVSGREIELAEYGELAQESAWSPDDRWLAYRADEALFIAAADGSSAPELVASAGAISSAPQWSPDGTELLHAAANGHELVVYDVARATSRTLVSTRPELLGYLGSRWSPLGDAIAYSAFFESPTDFKVRGGAEIIARAGGDPVRVVDFEDATWWGNDLQWRPDGRALVYVDLDHSRREVVIRQLDLATGDGPELIDTVNGGLGFGSSSGCPTWSSDGRTLLYIRWQPPGDAPLWAFDVSTGTRRPLDLVTWNLWSGDPIWLRHQPPEEN